MFIENIEFLSEIGANNLAGGIGDLVCDVSESIDFGDLNCVGGGGHYCSGGREFEAERRE